MNNWEELSKQIVRVFGADWCPDCVRFKQVLERNRVPYTEVNIDADPREKDYMIRKAGGFSIPQVEINGTHMVRGWHSEMPGKWNEQLFFQELTEALSTDSTE